MFTKIWPVISGLFYAIKKLLKNFKKRYLVGYFLNENNAWTTAYFTHAQEVYYQDAVWPTTAGCMVNTSTASITKALESELTFKVILEIKSKMVINFSCLLGLIC